MWRKHHKILYLDKSTGFFDKKKGQKKETSGNFMTA
jgi:hypothetical protein